MRQTLLVLSVIAFCFIGSVIANLSLPRFSLRKRVPPLLVNVLHARHGQGQQDDTELRNWLSNQQPVMDKVFSSSSTGDDSEKPVVADVLPKNRAINIFASLTRQFEPIESRLNDSSKNVTVLAPRNSAIQSLPRKPWENPEDYEKFGGVSAYEGQEGEDRAKQNLRRFVEAHIIPTSPWREGEEVETLGGEKLKWTKNGDKIYIQPSNVEVDNIAETVTNGELWILNGVINYR
ncbi:hypothetical protein CNMCM5623_005318 [Aspergillus felis]|uniref:FAS1 domain-containing protein n=1 Tax=Aspergillus felis TaxID=1287682 RepID=A0A8H6QZD9_9EURO|nr:hypothetical protein CNMCM5623_005318 [Aspergillus felis]KAF7182259.1 hypothetical protein CNMCM7691_001738 [Aspergillus felis]